MPFASRKGAPKPFYKGKTLRFTVPVAPGGTYDLWVRALAPHLEKHTGAKFLLKISLVPAVWSAAHSFIRSRNPTG